jgi:hypothetical protein
MRNACAFLGGPPHAEGASLPRFAFGERAFARREKLSFRLKLTPLEALPGTQENSAIDELAGEALYEGERGGAAGQAWR